MLQPQVLSTPTAQACPQIAFDEIEKLYGAYSKSAYAFALKILRDPALAEDAVQEAFLKYYRCPQNFDSAKGPFLTWLLTVVRNVCLDQLRKSKRNAEMTSNHNHSGLFVGVGGTVEEASDRMADIADTGLSVEEAVWLKIERGNIQAALRNIPAEQRQLVELAFFQGLTHKEIEGATGLPLGTIKSRIRQGLLKLKVQLDADKIIQTNNFIKK